VGSGIFNKIIILQYQTKVSDGLGGFVLSWVDHATIFAAIWPTSAKEQLASMQVSMEITHRIRIRYRSVLKPAWRIKFGNRYFNIVSIINPNMGNKYLDILAKEAA
jgi:SPP1 family predicted phage head-tail adaptor